MFHTYNKICRENLTIVLKGGREVSPLNFSTKVVLRLQVSNCFMGFYLTFNNKFHPGARAYFCKVGDFHHRLRRICPFRQLLVTLSEITQYEMFFPGAEITRAVLTKNMKGFCCLEKNVKPYSLGICVHTYYIVFGLETCFRDYLARRKVNKAVQTYYRASPHLTIFKLRQFFKQTFK